MIETGAYNVAWPDVHMQPEQSLQAHLDLRGRWMLPIHNGTFDLSIHGWQEPFERILTLANQAQVRLSTPQMGERGQPWLTGMPGKTGGSRGLCRQRGQANERTMAAR